MSEKRWKRVERELASRMGGSRIPLLGREGSDLDVPYLYVEVKSRKSIAPYLWNDYLAQILQGAAVAGTDKIPAIALHRPGMKYKDALVCIRAGDWEELVRRIQDGEE